MEELLGGYGDVGVCVDETLQVCYGETSWEVERNELLVGFMVGRDDRYGKARPVELTDSVS